MRNRLRAAVGILDKWRASSDQACRILRISRSTYIRARQRDPDWAVTLDADQMQRISFVLNIHAALRLVFDNPENVYGFPSMANDNDFFNGRSLLEIMAQGDMISLYETFPATTCCEARNGEAERAGSIAASHCRPIDWSTQVPTGRVV